jgi:erythromycin esterase-like protein
MTVGVARLTAAAEDEVTALARPLASPDDLDPLVARLATVRFACLGEASHGTHEFYGWRAELTRRLVEEEGFAWIGVEGDWPDCWRIHRWVTGQDDQERTADGVLAGFDRWPEWMWANHEVASFLDWLRAWNLERAPERRVGFYGLDVYSLWDSLRRIRDWLGTHAPDALTDAERAWQCFVPFHEDPHRYAWGTRLVPASCEDDVVRLLATVRARTHGLREESAFDALQNALVAAQAERYYRTMVRADGASWNIRDRHMTDTADRLAARHGPGSRGVVWAHNTHVGDARATDMARAGMVNVGQLLRERYGDDAVALVGMAAHRGHVLAASSWGAPERSFALPVARAGSHEDLLHRVLRRPSVLVFGPDRSGPWLGVRAGHRAVGVVYDPARESGNYVPTVMGARYDAQLWFEETGPVRPLHHEPPPSGPELETEPSGF